MNRRKLTVKKTFVADLREKGFIIEKVVRAAKASNAVSCLTFRGSALVIN